MFDRVYPWLAALAQDPRGFQAENNAARWISGSPRDDRRFQDHAMVGMVDRVSSGGMVRYFHSRTHHWDADPGLQPMGFCNRRLYLGSSGVCLSIDDYRSANQSALWRDEWDDETGKRFTGSEITGSEKEA